MTPAASAGDRREHLSLRWRVPLWFAAALLLSWACAYVWSRLGHDIPKAVDPSFYLPAVALSAGAAWACGLFGRRTSTGGKLWVALGSLVAPHVFFLIAIVVVVADLQAHVEQPPPIARGQEFGMEGQPIPHPAWTQALRRAFPKGSDESRLIVSLKSQGFTIDRSAHMAQMSYQGDTICRTYLWIDWKLSRDGRLVDVEGASMGACP
ncbi:MAG TPA: hypothetical protein VGB91_06420 [Rhizomicrobium sp.]